MSSSNGYQRNSLDSDGRKLRYRTLLEDLNDLDDDNANNMECIKKTSIVVREAENLMQQGAVEERAEHPGECYLDSQVLRAASHLAVRYSEGVSGNVNTYDKVELAQHIRQNPDFWCFSFPREVPAYGFLFGTFAPTPLPARPRAPRKQVVRQQAQALKAPDSVDQLEKTEECSQMVSKVHSIIKKTYRQTVRPLSYMHVVLDPTSFSATVENIYYVSFLVRENKISVDLDEEFGLPFITPMSKPIEQRDIAEENQFIVSIDKQRWQDLIKAFGITKPMLVFKR